MSNDFFNTSILLSIQIKLFHVKSHRKISDAIIEMLTLVLTKKTKTFQRV